MNYKEVKECIEANKGIEYVEKTFIFTMKNIMKLAILYINNNEEERYLSCFDYIAELRLHHYVHKNKIL